jgi:hypothetical protein
MAGHAAGHQLQKPRPCDDAHTSRWSRRGGCSTVASVRAATRRSPPYARRRGVVETREYRESANGTDRRQIVLRLRDAAEAYSEDLRAIRFLTKPPALQKAGPVTGPALGRAKPGQRIPLGYRQHIGRPG